MLHLFHECGRCPSSCAGQATALHHANPSAMTTIDTSFLRTTGPALLPADQDRLLGLAVNRAAIGPSTLRASLPSVRAVRVRPIEVKEGADGGCEETACLGNVRAATQQKRRSATPVRKWSDR